MTTLERFLVMSGVAAFVFGATCVVAEGESRAQSTVPKTSTVKVYVHMMPWFENPTTSGTGAWGIHWTMSNQNPNVVDGSGRRQIASYYYPLIGPYGSSDHDVIEYQLLLMKYAGIDGVLIDWPGTINAFDYPKNKQNAEAIMAMVPKMGLQFGVVYEDNNVNNAFTANKISDKIGAGKADLSYVRDNYFTNSSYIQVNGAPLLLDFGPQTFTQSSDWDTLFSVFSTKPTFLTLWYESNSAGANAAGEFAWVAMDYTTGLSSFYQNRPLYVRFGAAYPGYNSFYAAGGWGTSAWTIPVAVDTFNTTLGMALSNVSSVQIATWNDYGEGTMIEPTVEFQYGYLTALQQTLGVQGYSMYELQLIATLFQQRKMYAGDAGRQAQLDQASTDLANLAVNQAATILGAPVSSSSGSGGGSTSSGSSSSGSSGSGGSTSGGSAPGGSTSSGGSGGSGSGGNSSGGSTGSGSGGQGPGVDGGQGDLGDSGTGSNGDNLIGPDSGCSCRASGAPGNDRAAFVVLSLCAGIGARRRRTRAASLPH